GTGLFAWQWNRNILTMRVSFSAWAGASWSTSTTVNNRALLSGAESSEAKLFTRGWSIFLSALLLLWAIAWICPGINLHAVADVGHGFADSLHAHFPRVNEDSPLLWILCPTMLMIAWGGSLLLLYNRPPDSLRLPVGIVFLFFQVTY